MQKGVLICNTFRFKKSLAVVKQLVPLFGCPGHLKRSLQPSASTVVVYAPQAEARLSPAAKSCASLAHQDSYSSRLKISCRPLHRQADDCRVAQK